MARKVRPGTAAAPPAGSTAAARAAAAPAAAPVEEPALEAVALEAVALEVGCVVTVSELRGNGDGGVGKISEVHSDGSVDVAYILGGRGRRVAPDRVRPGDHSKTHYAREGTAWVGKVDAFFDAETPDFRQRVAVLKLDDIVDKKDKKQVAYVLQKLLSDPRPPVQVAFLQGATPLQGDPLFSQLLDFIAFDDPKPFDDSNPPPPDPPQTAPAAKKPAAERNWRRTGSHWLGRRLSVDFKGRSTTGVVGGWLDASSTNVRASKFGPFVALYHVAFDDCDAPCELQEYEVRNALAQSDDGAAGVPVDARLPRLFSVNLGELALSPPQLGRLRDALSSDPCLVSYMFFECNNLFAAAFEDAPGAACARAPKGDERRKGRQNEWKDSFRACVRRNRAKHDLWRLRDGCAVQNAVVLQAVKSWFNPVAHGENKRWLAAQKVGSSEHLILDALAVRARREDRIVAGGDRVRLLQSDVGSSRGDVRGVLLSPTMLATDDGETLTVQPLPSGFAKQWLWDDAPEAGDVCDYDSFNLLGFPLREKSRGTLFRNVLIRQRHKDPQFADWSDCTFSEDGVLRDRQLRFAAIDAQPVERFVWRLEHALGSTGAAAVAERIRRLRRPKGSPNPRPGDMVFVESVGKCKVVRIGDCRFLDLQVLRARAAGAPTKRRALYDDCDDDFKVLEGRGHLRRSKPREKPCELSSTALTRKLRIEAKEAAPRGIDCDLVVAEGGKRGRDDVYEFRLSLAPDGEPSKWRRLADADARPDLVVASEEWEATAIVDARKSARDKLREKYVGAFLRIVQVERTETPEGLSLAGRDELRRIVDVVPVDAEGPAKAPKWQAQTELLDGGAAPSEARYAIAELPDLIARAPAKLQAAFRVVAPCD